MVEDFKTDLKLWFWSQILEFSVINQVLSFGLKYEAGAQLAMEPPCPSLSALCSRHWLEKAILGECYNVLHGHQTEHVQDYAHSLEKPFWAGPKEAIANSGRAEDKIWCRPAKGRRTEHILMLLKSQGRKVAMGGALNHGWVTLRTHNGGGNIYDDYFDVV